MFQNTWMRAALLARQGWFPALWFFVGMVSAIDTRLIKRFSGVLSSLEENPVGRFLIELDNGNVAVFIRMKVAGTALVLSVLVGLYIYRRRWSFPITASIAAYQFGLLLYLVFARGTYTPAAEAAWNLASDPAACVEMLRDGIASVLPTSDGEPLSVPKIRLRGQAGLRDRAGLAPR
jgi:hypothetical protein